MSRGGAILLVVAIVGTLVPLVWWGFQSLWNAIVPSVFGGPSLTYWQAAGLLVLFGFVSSGLRATVRAKP